MGGQATRLWKHYFDSVSGIIYVVDCTDKARLVKARDELHKVSRDEALAGVPYLILINKWDLEDQRMEEEFIAKSLDLDLIKNSTDRSAVFM